MQQFLQRHRHATIVIAASYLSCASLGAHARVATPPSPSQLYGEVFERVQGEKLYPDSKTFADAVAKSPPDSIMRRYAASKDLPGFSLRDFVADSFTIPGAATADFVTAPREELRAHVER